MNARMLICLDGLLAIMNLKEQRPPDSAAVEHRLCGLAFVLCEFFSSSSDERRKMCLNTTTDKSN